MRFTLGALREILQGRTYAAKVALLPASKHQRMTHSSASGGSISMHSKVSEPCTIMFCLPCM